MTGGGFTYKGAHDKGVGGIQGAWAVANYYHLYPDWQGERLLRLEGERVVLEPCILTTLVKGHSQPKETRG